MEKRNVEITLDTARKWYYGDNESLREVALQAFTKNELIKDHLRRITTISSAVEYLREKNICTNLIQEYNRVRLHSYDSYIARVLEYQMVVAALTNNEERHLTTGEKWYPVVQFCRLQDRKNCWGNVYIGTIESEGKIYDVVGGRASTDTHDGLGFFALLGGVSGSITDVGFRSVSSKEIAQHIATYFGKLLFDIHYGGTNCDWKWIR